MKNYILIGLIAVMPFLFAEASAQKVSHDKWNALLQKHVTSDGHVNYKGFIADKAKLDEYLKILGANHPTKSWSENERMAFWINAYNAFTVKLIIDNYPLKSIRDIGKPWDEEIVKIGTSTYTLNHVENGILRKEFNDPRIHFGIVCASYSCPKLHNKAFTAANLDATLDTLAKSFVNDPKRNKITANSVEISEIFNWFKGDFTKNGTVIDFLNKYSKTKISSSAKISYMPYNWSLNS